MKVEVDDDSVLPVANTPYGLCGRKAVLNLNTIRDQELPRCESRGGRPYPYGLCGRTATLN